MSRRPQAFKIGVDGLEHQRMTVSSHVAAGRPLVEFRLHAHGQRERTIEFNTKQARATMRALAEAIEAVEAASRHDGDPSDTADRVSACEGVDDELRRTV